MAAAIVHFAVTPEHFAQSWLYGAFFLCAASVQVIVAVLLLVRPARQLLTAVAAGSICIVALWVVSRVVGVPVGPDNGATEPFGTLDVLATIAELVTATSCIVAVLVHRFQAGWRWSLWSLAMRLALLATIVGTPLMTAVSKRG
ncbi:MAG TPA: hypothetical protein VNG12_16945 [Acidimicrobiales bacterium]|nr:hypothetical protein [Acidimicrobiales bacterium]